MFLFLLILKQHIIRLLLLLCLWSSLSLFERKIMVEMLQCLGNTFSMRKIVHIFAIQTHKHTNRHFYTPTNRHKNVKTLSIA